MSGTKYFWCIKCKNCIIIYEQYNYSQFENYSGLLRYLFVIWLYTNQSTINSCEDVVFLISFKTSKNNLINFGQFSASKCVPTEIFFSHLQLDLARFKKIKKIKKKKTRNKCGKTKTFSEKFHVSALIE